MRRPPRALRVLVLAIGLITSLGLLWSVSAVAAGDTTVTLRARLTGAQEVPPADPDGLGKVDVHIDAAAGQVCFDVKLNDVATPNRGHIHAGASGVNGPIVVPFFELRPGDALSTDPRHEAIEQGRLQDCVPGDPAILAAIVANPAGYYVNVHNSRFPGGALRCQLEA
jgi:hypothetical protein